MSDFIEGFMVVTICFFVGFFVFLVVGVASYQSEVVVGVLDGVSGSSSRLGVIVDGVEFKSRGIGVAEFIGSGVFVREIEVEELRGLVGQKVKVSFVRNWYGFVERFVLEVV